MIDYRIYYDGEFVADVKAKSKIGAIRMVVQKLPDDDPRWFNLFDNRTGVHKVSDCCERREA